MKEGTFRKKLDAIRKGAINVTANVLSAPAQYKAYKAGKQADSDVKVLKMARAYDNAPDYDSMRRPTDAFKARSVANEVRERLTPKPKEKPARRTPAGRPIPPRRRRPTPKPAPVPAPTPKPKDTPKRRVPNRRRRMR